MSDDSEPLFRVVFNGNTTGEFDVETTKQRFGKLLNLSPKKVERAFNSPEVIIKEKVSEEAAMQLAIKLAESGCECYIEEVEQEPVAASGEADATDDNDPTKDPSFVERRKGPRRRHFPSRNVTEFTGQERRQSHGRRKTDEPMRASR